MTQHHDNNNSPTSIVTGVIALETQFNQVQEKEKEVNPEIRDLETLKNWVKDDLFQTQKFVFEPQKELEAGGQLHRKFVLACEDRLIGVKKPGNNREQRKLYLHMLWTKANVPKTNYVMNGLQNRRSSVYTAMYNRFMGKW